MVNQVRKEDQALMDDQAQLEHQEFKENQVSYTDLNKN